MNSRYFPGRIWQLVASVSIFTLALAGCNKQPSAPATGAATEAPPIAALPLAAAAVTPAAPAPAATELPPAPRLIGYAEPPPQERYRNIDRAYEMGEAFADTPPDYAVDYQGTRPWIWRAGNGAYRIVERLPRGERIYYYEPGQDQPFLVRDPDYSYAYDHGELLGVYGPDGAELDRAMAEQRADEASRYFERSRELYRAAQYQRRQSAYAGEWASRRAQIRAQRQMWQQEQARNAQWRSWHNEHQAEEAQRWQQERNQRLAYAAAIGIAAASSGAMPNPGELARRQAAYFSDWNARRGRAPLGQEVASRSTPAGPSQSQTQPVQPTGRGPVPSAQRTSNVQPTRPVAPQTKVGQAQQLAAQGKQKEAAAGQVKTAQVAKAQQPVAEAKGQQAAAAQAKAAQAAQAQQAAAESKRREAAAAQVKVAQAAQAQQAAADARRKEATAARARATQAAQAEQAAAEAKRKEALATQAKAAEAQRAAAEVKRKEALAAQAKAAQAQQAAAEAKRKEAAAAEAKSAAAAQAERAAAEAKRHEAAAAQAKVPPAHSQHSEATAHPPKAEPRAPKAAVNSAKRKDEAGKGEQKQ